MAFVRSNDGRVTAFDAATGERRWFWAHDMPLLTVRGNDAPSLRPGYVFVGDDAGTVPAPAVAEGHEIVTPVIDHPEGPPQLDHLADITPPPVLQRRNLDA